MKTNNLDFTHYILAIIMSFLIGAIGSLFGIGGGPLLVPVMIYFIGLGGSVARGTSLALVIVSGVLGLVSRGYLQKLNPDSFFELRTFLIMVIPLAIGSLFVSQIIEYFTGVKIDIDPAFEIILRRAFGGLVILIGAVMVIFPS
ncbi:MAG: sulfite exporter TauE/SafE family protein [Candidatus Bathyarchaeota archaeon]|nr:sulfite exporter TauE/SafE family protein [Candidatus Bathyarchaeota archaeon]